MKRIGIVAEYNPFHNGHALQIQYAKEVLHADQVIIAMSGYFTQRGTPSVLDPYTRAEMALKNGADLVIQIPTVFSCASAREYAAAGVLTLANTGIVDTLLFGAETADPNLFEAAAEGSILIDNSLVEEDNEISPMIAEGLSNGIGFAKARSNVLEQLIKDSVPDVSEEDIKEFVASPNNILGIQYVQAIKEHSIPMSYEIIPRKGGQYHSKEIREDGLASASAIRHKIYPALHGKDVSDYFNKSTPPSACDLLLSAVKEKKIVIYDDLSLPAWQRLYDAVRDNALTDFTDCSEDLANKIIKTFGEYTTIKAYCKYTLRSKDLTFTRVNRVMAHILLGITDEITDEAKANGYVPYLFVLGIAEGSSDLISSVNKYASVPVIVQPKTADSILTGIAIKMFKIDEAADALYTAVIASKTNLPGQNMYQKKFLTVKD